MAVDPPNNAVPLRSDSLGVATESKPRSLQQNGEQAQYYTYLNRQWLDTLNLAVKGAQTVHSLSMATQPVIVRQPAIIVQPAEVIHD